MYFCEECREPAAYFSFGTATERVCICKEHICKSVQLSQALYPMSAYTFLDKDEDYCLYKERVRQAEGVKRRLMGLIEALDGEKEAAVLRLKGEKERIGQLIGFAYEEMQWRLMHAVAEKRGSLDRYISEVENYTKAKDCSISRDITDLPEATCGTILAFSLRDVACEVVEIVLGSGKWQAELCLSPLLPTVSTTCCDLEAQLEGMLLHGYGQEVGTEKVEGLMEAAKVCAGQWEKTEQLYSRAAAIGEVYAPCQAAECWVVLGKHSQVLDKPTAKHCFLQAFSLLHRLPTDSSTFALLKSIGKLGLRVEEFEAAIATLERAVSLPGLPSSQRFLGLLGLLRALAIAGETLQYASRLENALSLVSAASDQVSLLIYLNGLLLKAGKCTEASETLSKAVTLGEAHLAKGDFDSAKALLHRISQYMRFTKQHHLLPRTLHSVGKMQLQLRQWASAYDTLAELHFLTAFSNEKIAILLGQICLELQRRSEGVRLLQSTIQELQKLRKEPSGQLKALLQRLQMSPN